MNTSPAKVDCPTCGNTVEWTPESRWRPFCSERCRLIDLGEWFGEERRIPAEEQAPTVTGVTEAADTPPPIVCHPR